MTILLYSIIGGLMGLYLLAFAYETIVSITRLFQPGHRKGYVDATWEITHTLFIFGFTMLMITHGSLLPQLAPVIYWPIFITGGAFLIRGILYLQLFYIREQGNRSLYDWLFALAHLVMAGGLVTSILLTIQKLQSTHYQPDTSYVWLFVPGLVIMLAISTIPVIRLYTTREE